MFNRNCIYNIIRKIIIIFKFPSKNVSYFHDSAHFSQQMKLKYFKHANDSLTWVMDGRVCCMFLWSMQKLLGIYLVGQFYIPTLHKVLFMLAGGGG